MSLAKHEALESAWLHLKSVDDEPLYAENENGEPDLNKPLRIEIWSPASKQYRNHKAKQQNAQIALLKARKSDRTAEDALRERVENALAVSKGSENIEEDFRTVYENPKFGYIADQVIAFSDDWANFKKPSPKS